MSADACATVVRIESPPPLPHPGNIRDQDLRLFPGMTGKHDADWPEVTGMSGGGEYAAHSLSQQACMRLLHAHVRAALRPHQDSRTRCVLADYGAADGLATRQLIEEAVEAGLQQRLDVVLQDLPGNDWQAAARILSPLGTLDAPSPGQSAPVSVLQMSTESGHGDVALRLFAAPGTFHVQVLPDGSVDLAVSGTALHWLSNGAALPRPGVPVVFHPHVDPTVRAAWDAHAARDWKAILVARAAELRPGGKLIAVLPTLTPDGCSTYSALFDVMDQMLRRAESAGRLKVGAREAFAVPASSRSHAAIREGFAQVPSLELEVLEQHVVASPYYDEAEAGTKAGRAAFARRYVASVYAWAGPMLQGLAVGEQRDADVFRTEMEGAIAARMEECKQDYIVSVLVAVKKVGQSHSN